MGILKSIVTGIFGGSKIVDKGLDLADKYIEDKDKRNEISGKIILNWMSSPPTIPIFDAIHKLGRQIMMFVLAYWYYSSWKEGNPIPIEDFMIIAGGPALYTVIKGAGRS